MIKYLTKCSNIGKMMLLIGLLVVFPIIVLPFYTDEAKYTLSFIIPGGASILIGILVCLFGKKEMNEENYDFKTSLRKSSVTVVFSWLWGVLIGALPFVIGCGLTMVQGLFEAVSGWTTTGLSVIDVANCPQIFLFHRSFMQYCGGLGFVMMMIVLISSKKSMDLYSAEGHPDQIMPNIKKTARAIFIIYNVCLVAGTLAYVIAGMTFFDGICHAMCSLSTGGFSTKLRSIGEYNSLSIELITIALMIIGTTNFAALILLARGKFKKFTKVSEVRFMALILLIFIPITALSLMQGLKINGEGITFWKALRISAFDISSALSTTGYSTMSYTTWPPFAIGMLIIMMLIGGGIGSTAGGIKMTRIYIMMRVGFDNIRKRLHPKENVTKLYYNKAQGRERISNSLIGDTFAFIGIYLTIYIFGSLLITVTADCGIMEAMFEFASSMGTVGLSIGITGPTTNALTLIIEMFGMFMGRLELFIVFISIACGFRWFKDLFRKKERN